VLSDFAKADRDWLEPLLDAIAKAAPRLARDDPSRFLTDVAKDLGEEPDPRKGKSTTPEKAGAGEAASPTKPAAAAPRAHPAGDRASKSANALADNLRKWLAGRKSGG
jgi:PTH1 family peptidyl-tRNA hydrolase